MTMSPERFCGSSVCNKDSPLSTRSQHHRREMWLLLEAEKDRSWEGCRSRVTGGDNWDPGTQKEHSRKTMADNS